jgi:hypothetical protein
MLSCLPVCYTLGGQVSQIHSKFSHHVGQFNQILGTDTLVVWTRQECQSHDTDKNTGHFMLNSIYILCHNFCMF